MSKARPGRRNRPTHVECQSLEARRLLSAVVARHLFYDNSYFDQFTAGPGPSDDAAIAIDKQALLPGEQAAGHLQLPPRPHAAV